MFRGFSSSTLNKSPSFTRKRYRMLFAGLIKPISAWFASGSLILLLILWSPMRSSASGIDSEADHPAVIGFSSRTMTDGAPEGWQLQRYRGEPVMTMQKAEDLFYLTMTSSGDKAFGIKKELSLDLRQYPFLNWQWRANRLPPGGDIRRSDRDDQAMQLYLIFKTPRTLMALQEPSLGYIWDSEAPERLMVKSPQRSMGAVRYIVVRSGANGLGQWHREKRNVFDDGRNAFRDVRNGEPLCQVRGALLFINTHHTKGEAEADIGEIYFSRK
jgi:hypothetical protein